ncbi:MAG: DUF4118 domain-containing protein [Acutalibacteraceae bacterium]|nr:DUF4118 domain-containing protein [Acutalibacteraceae bacterium]
MNGEKKIGVREEHILVCLSSSPSNKKIIHTASKMAKAYKASLTALYIETPRDDKMSDEDRNRLADNIRLAEKSGAHTVTLNGGDVSYQIAEFARLSGITQIVIGRSSVKRRRLHFKPTLTEKLSELLPETDIHIIPNSVSYKAGRESLFEKPDAPSFKDFVITALVLAAATLIGLFFHRLGFTEANIITVYILGVLLVSVLTKGYVCSIISSILSVILFNFFLTEPRLTLHAYESGYPITFAIMLAASIITGTLAAKLKAHAKLSAQSAFRTKVLFDTNRMLQNAVSDEEILKITSTQLMKLLNRSITAYGVSDGRLGTGYLFSSDSKRTDDALLTEKERQAAEWTVSHQKRCGATTKVFPEAKCLYLAIRINNRVYGAVGIPINGKPLDSFEYNILLSILGECAMAMDNSFNAREREASAIKAKNEQLKSDLLRAISHDLRTPLTTISGNANSLINSFSAIDDETKLEMITDIYDDSQWLASLVENLLSITRIEENRVKLNMSDQLVEEVIGESLKHISRKSSEHTITVENRNELLLAKMDSKLIIQVIINLVENAIKYTPKGSEIKITALKKDGKAVISVADNGDGISDAMKPKVFDMFVTGENKISDSRRSLGLGLSLCKSIVNAHGGDITLTDNEPHGSVFSFTLPLSEVNLNE